MISNTMLLIAAVVLLVVLLLMGNHGNTVKPGGEPLSIKTILGMIRGKPEAWADFKRLFGQPTTPPEKKG